ncbi:TlyA family RNA methyltransferase [Campylobacter mucosalis]|uniref:16S/23S rRNA (Cytidine-2'-O)-methyltransferase n=1 Tax=Campylobacter mucosalis CCUG 21559 TaxID=1032067 RepID=A0A6G5QI60_9BACT|nr:TlyA family RNA methyltransferase [Campylobacter mucosalis]QCD45186.1 16S/23S rRNA (cytidine-2'-O)-methyltransferase [Campylobacter mucosalis CCUG 21559]
MRADLYVSNALNISRNKAAELIKSAKILADDKPLKKVSDELENAKITLLDDIFVGRGALKLKGFLDSFDFEICGKNALDIGSSTGGFIQILLLKGVKSVVGVDVGTNQLDALLRADDRVKIYENTDIREFKSERKFELITADVSFISLTQILKSIDDLALKNATIILLFKPQFEVGKEAKRDKKGVVVDKKAIALAERNFRLEAAKFGWILKEIKECELKGKEGNAEIFYAFNKI